MNANMLTSLRILVLIGLRNLSSHKVKSSIVGSIMLFGTVLMIIGTSLLDSIEVSMERVVTSSLAGHLQVYSSESKDQLSLFGGLTASQPEIGEMEDFYTIRKQLEKVPNIKAIVPQGITISTGSGGNDIDRVLRKLRKAIQDKDDAAISKASGQILQIAKLLRDEQEQRKKISSESNKIKDTQEVLQKVLSDEFWALLKTQPEEQLMYLDSHFASLAQNGRLFFIRALGTNPTQFQQNFDRFTITTGEMIPKGKRGLLISDRNYNRFFKHRIARQLDRLKRAVDDEGKVIDEDDGLKGDVRRMSRQYRRIMYQLDPTEAQKLESLLREELKITDKDKKLEELVSSFLLVDTANFQHRYDYFYKNIAPFLELYRVNVGEVITLQAFTRRGYIKSVNVKVWGTFKFEGIEGSDLAGVVNVMDMITFRELYGKMSDSQRDELKEMRKEVGIKDVSRDSAEDELFGGDDSEELSEEATTDTFDEFTGVKVLSREQRIKDLEEETFTDEDFEKGVALNAAIVLKDRTKLEETRTALEALIAQQKLKLKVIDWQQASGIVGQLVIVIRVVLYIAIAIIFLVALVIMNNSMVMATMERVSEIGTMRAIGAQRRFVLLMFLFETLVLGAIAGIMGALLGIGVLGIMNLYGIPATSDIMRFIFAGPRLHPFVSVSNVIVALIIIFIVSIISTLYPAIVATRIQPVVAMRGRD